MKHWLTKWTVACSVLVLAMTLAGLAQSSTTVVLKSGEQKPVQNLGFFDGNQVIVRTSFAEEPRFVVGDVAYIDFAGNRDVAVRFRASPHAVVLRDGNVVTGQVTRIAHAKEEDQTSPYVVSVRTSSGQERQFQQSEVSRVYFAQPIGLMADQGVDRRRGGAIGTVGGDDLRTVTVSARELWTPTGLIVRRGERLGFLATGQIHLSTSGLTASPDGSGQNDPGSPLPQNYSGALIARIGNGRPFAIGSQTEVEMPESGAFILGINDSVLTDNDGAFRVEVRRIR